MNVVRKDVDVKTLVEPNAKACATGSCACAKNGRVENAQHARTLEYLTIGWNLVEAGVALGAGVIAGSIALVGFGVDTLIEILSSVILLWRLLAVGGAALAWLGKTIFFLYHIECSLHRQHRETLRSSNKGASSGVKITKPPRFGGDALSTSFPLMKYNQICCAYAPQWGQLNTETLNVGGIY